MIWKLNSPNQEEFDADYSFLMLSIEVVDLAIMQIEDDESESDWRHWTGKRLMAFLDS